MILTDNLFNANSVATAYIKTQDVNNTLPMIGPAFFPARKKMGLDLKTIRTHKGLYVQLAASNFDAMPTLRVRGTFQGESKEMAFFRESMLVREYDLIELMKIESEKSPFFDDIMANIYDDTNELIQASDIIPEIMRMQLLAPVQDGSPRIYIKDAVTGVLYEYNYDVDGSYKTSNYVVLTGNDTWDKPATAKPFDNLKAAKRFLGSKGATPRYALMNQTTFDKLAQIDSVRNAVLAQNLTANIDMDDDTVRRIWRSKTQTEIVIYDKVYADQETGKPIPFYPDGYVALLPEGALGNTWYGTTPEERTLMGDPTVDVSIVNTGVAIAVKREYGPPVKITTTASMITLPSYERMDETYVMKVFEPAA